MDEFKNRLNDAYFKYLFFNYNFLHFLFDLLNCIFEKCPLPCVTEKIAKVTLEDRELLTYHEGEKAARLDVHTIINDNLIIDIEAQCKVDKTIVNRSLFYASRLLSTQQMEGKPYDQIQPVIIINILKENHFPDKPNDYITISGTTDITNNIIASDTVTTTPTPQTLLTDKQHFIFIEAHKCVKFGDPNHRLTKWMTYLRSTTDDVIQDLAKNDKIFQQVLKAEKAFRGNTSNMSEYSFYESARNKIAFEAMQAKAEAIAEGKAEGRAEGKAEGKAEAIAEAKAEADLRVKQVEAEVRAEAAEAVAKVTAEAEAKVAEAEAKAAEAVAKANLETAKKLIAMGLSSDVIKEATKLTDSQLASLEL